MTTQELLQKYKDFYIQKDHKEIPNVSLVPENDSTLLFVNSGMFPLVPYLTGEKHPLGNKLVNVQRCIRIEDIDEIGDPIHTLAFHMIGNWSLNDYFKKDQLTWLFDYLTNVLNLSLEKIFFTVFAGDNDSPKDEETISILQDLFKNQGIEAKIGEKIFLYGKENNWWQRGDTVGELGGPDCEVFYYLGEGSSQGKSLDKNEDEFIEIGNSVFMQYKKMEEGWKEIEQKNVDFGGGLERQAMVVQGKKDIFETDNFWSLIEKIQQISGKNYYENEKIKSNMRIIADHARACTFLTMDGVAPSNKDQGYILRRLFRRMIRAGRFLEINRNFSVELVPVVINMFGWMYPQLLEKEKEITEIFGSEENKFISTLNSGQKQLDRILEKNTPENSQEWAYLFFDLFQSLGFPKEISMMEVLDRKHDLNVSEVNQLYEDLFNLHQEGSRSGSEQKFKGGLSDNSEVVVKYHTTTHLLQKALKDVLGEHVSQIGSNITNERLRFDFPNTSKLTPEQLQKVEEIVNSLIDQEIPVRYEFLEKNTAIMLGATYMIHESYPDPVKVYYIGEDISSAVSKEFCGGPHVQNTSEIPHIQVYKQESIGQGKMRIYAKFL